MEQRFGHDFSRVQVHLGAGAEQSARAVNARAYTLGNHIVFGASQFAPATEVGGRLLGHELTHVLQGSASVLRRNVVPGQLTQQPLSDAALEARADKIFEQAATELLREKGKEVTPEILGSMRRQITVGVLQGYKNGKLVTLVNGHNPKWEPYIKRVMNANEAYVEGVAVTPYKVRTEELRKSGHIYVHSEQVLAAEARSEDLTQARVATSNNACTLQCMSNLRENYPEVVHVNPNRTFLHEHPEHVIPPRQPPPIPDKAGRKGSLTPGAGTPTPAGDPVPKGSIFEKPLPRPPLPKGSIFEQLPAGQRTASGGGGTLAPVKPPQQAASGEIITGEEAPLKPTVPPVGQGRGESEPSIIVTDPALRGQVTKEVETTHVESGTGLASGELPPRSVFARERPIIETEPPIIATDPRLRGQVQRGDETTHFESGKGLASGVITAPPTQFSPGTRATAGVLGVLTVASEIMGSIALARDPQLKYNARMEATVRFFSEYGGKPQFVMEDHNTGVQQPSGTTESDTGVVWGDWIAPRLESVNVQALLEALPGRLTTMQSLVEFLGTGGMLKVIEQSGTRYFLTGKGVGYVEITDTIERIRSNLMRGLDESARAQMAAKGGAGVYRIRSSDVTIYRYAKGVREPWRVRHIDVPIITASEFSGANMWVREVGDKGDRVHVEPANAEAAGLAQNAWYIVPKAVGDLYDEVEGSGRTIKSRQPADGPLEGFIAAPLPPELGYTRYLKHPNPDGGEFTIAMGELRQFWVDRDDLEPVSADQVAAYARGTPSAPPPTHFFRTEERRDLPGA